MEEAHDPKNGEGRPGCCGGHLVDANREAHDFIPAAYWLGHFEEVRTALARAEVWGFETEARAEISGFIGLLGDYIAGIFVRREARSGGVGRQLLDHVKTSRGSCACRSTGKTSGRQPSTSGRGSVSWRRAWIPRLGKRNFLWSGDGTARRADPRYARRMDIREVDT